MKRLGVLTLLAILVLGGSAEARTSKAAARLAADGAALELDIRRADIDDTQIGACRRRSPDRFVCQGRAFGEEFEDCGGEIVNFACYYTVTRCRFSVKVHRAGYSVLGRIRGLRCEAEPVSR